VAGVGGERGIERDGALLGQCCSGAIMDGGWSHQADAAVAVFMVVPVEEPLQAGAGLTRWPGGRERLVGRVEPGSAFIAGGDQLEQYTGFGLILGNVGDIVEDQQLVLVGFVMAASSPSSAARPCRAIQAFCCL